MHLYCTSSGDRGAGLVTCGAKFADSTGGVEVSERCRSPGEGLLPSPVGKVTANKGAAREDLHRTRRAYDPAWNVRQAEMAIGHGSTTPQLCRERGGLRSSEPNGEQRRIIAMRASMKS